ncbi:MAG: hypothetical protein ACRDTJ_22505 [Pseudonocardiaceae bacterium]
MTREELLARLLLERYTPVPRAPDYLALWDDSEISTARRRRALVAAWDEHKERGAA